MYRFLIDPEPYQSLNVDISQGAPGVVVAQGTDQTLLQQRSDFLRPDSALAVVMISDENDCSITDFGQGFYAIIPASGASATSVLGHGTTPCLKNPNDRCCYNCGQATPQGCPPKDSDPECQAGPWTRDKDPENLRCWQQKQRYGFDFLYPVKRYIDGFLTGTVLNRQGVEVTNPLYGDLSVKCRMTGACAPVRDKGLVFLLGVVGVPWQDIAVDPLDLTKGYLKPRQLVDNGVWPSILGDPSAGPPVPTGDPHMIESIAPRTGAGIQPPSSGPNADPINGHEWDPSMATPTPNADLQYACIFPLSPTRVCTGQVDCDCFVPAGGNAAASQNPLCQNTSGQYGNVQTRGKAYPGIRQLQVLKGLGEQGVVGSICPANMTNMAAADFGYRPVVGALVDRLRDPLRGRCFPRQLSVQPDGKVLCTVVEAFTPPPGGSCACNDKPGRVPADPSTITPEVKAQGSCFCEITQLDGADLAACQTLVSPPGNVHSGWCYVDPSQPGPNTAAECPLVKSCPATNRRIVRYVNPDSEPRTGSTAFLVCGPGATSPGPVGTDPCP